MWVAPAISINGVIYYRLTAGVLAWLEAAYEVLSRAVDAGRVERGQLDEFLAVMDDVYCFAWAWLDAAEMEAARGRPPELPEWYCPTV